MHQTALIVGAGIGGLSAAIALRQAGWNVRVFAQAPSPRELGFGVGIAPNAVAALDKLGVADTVVARSFVPRRGELRRMDGSVLKRAELPPNALGGPMLVALRPALHGALLDAVGLDAISLGHQVAGFTAAGDRVTLQLANGKAVDGDVLVGADGIGSTIRQVLHPDEPPPRCSGIVAVRGAVHGVVHHLGDRDAVYYLGPGVESMFVRASDTGIYWFLSLSQALVGQGVTDPAEVVAAMSPQFDGTFRAITSATDDMRLDHLVDRDPLRSWGRDNVTLLGDAAHPMLPQTGQGAAQAIVDGVRLAEAFKADSNIEHALRAYERERIPRTAALVAQGRRTARVMATMNPVACALRELVIRAIPMTTFARVFMRINRRAGTDIRRQ